MKLSDTVFDIDLGFNPSPGKKNGGRGLTDGKR